MKNKQQKVQQIAVAPEQPAVIIKECSLFEETMRKHVQNPAVRKAMAEFIAWKKANPLLPFGSKDRRFASSNQLGEYTHAGLTFDVSVVYKISGRNPHVIYLYAVMTHDELGTGQPSNPKAIKSSYTKFQNQTF